MKNKYLNEFNEGGKHSQNPLGGIPQGIGSNGKPNLVEQGETSFDSKNGKYIFSDSLETNDIMKIDLISEFNLPKYIKGKSFSEASKAINNKFKDRNDKASLNTQKELLNRLTEAQEYTKMQKALKNNSQEVPDNMNGVVPEGMNQFNEGGFSNFIKENGEGIASAGSGALKMIGNLSGEGVSTNAASAGLSGAAEGAMAGAALGPLGAIGGGILGGVTSLIGSGKAKKELLEKNMNDTQGFRNDKLNTFKYGGSLRSNKYALGGQIDPNDSRIPEYAQGDKRFEGVPFRSNRYERLLSDIKKKHNTSIDTSGVSDLYRAAPLAKSVQGGSPSALGTYRDLLMKGRKGRPETTPITEADMKLDLLKGINSTTSNSFRNGGSISSLKPLTTKEDLQFRANPLDNLNTPTLQGRPSPELPKEQSNFRKLLGQGASYLKDNAPKLARLAPVATNALQLSNLKRPQHESLNRLNTRYKRDLVDEKTLQNLVNEQYGGTAEKLANAAGGSTSGLRASLLGAQLNKSKALSDAFSRADQNNRSENELSQKFNLGVDKINLQQDNLEGDINAKNRGSFESNKSKLISQLGTDVGRIGKEASQMASVAKMFGYTWDGKFMRDKKGKIINLNKGTK